MYGLLFQYWWILLPAILLGAIAQLMVRGTYQKYRQVKTRGGITGAEVALHILDGYGFKAVPIETVPGELTDHYDPGSKKLRLSQDVARGDNIAALGIAAHETGHAIQHARSYFPLAARNTIYPVASFGSKLGPVIVLGGLLFGFSELLISIGIVLFAVAVVFSIVTLPIELNASARLRLYSAWGLSAVEITKMVLFNTLTLWIGYLTLGGLFFALEPLALPQTLHFPLLSVRPLGIAFLAVAGAYVFFVTLFSCKHVEYSQNPWWQFAANADAPRSLRALVAAGAVAFVVALFRLFSPRPERAGVGQPLDRERIRAIIQQSSETSANLSLLGDKSFLFSAQGEAFLMYGTAGRSWISMGDPVGPPDQRRELAWRFRELCDRYNGWSVFYEVGADSLPLYLEMGLTMVKLGEEARVPLDTFTLEGGARKNLRYTYNRLQREGNTFEVLPEEQVQQVIEDLERISDAWLAEKNTREKGFSLGFFHKDYLVEFPVAVIRRNGKIVAFTNIWTTASKEELSIDLMRYHPDAPDGVMEFLFVHLMLWGRQYGYRWFNLGMAPLAGLENRPLAPTWSRLASLVYRHGEHFYNFQGLREYKDKFDPVWAPRYLASPGGMPLPRILVDLSSLVSGGLKGIIAR